MACLTHVPVLLDNVRTRCFQVHCCVGVSPLGLTLDRGGARMYHLQSTASLAVALPSFRICIDSTIPSGPPISNSHAK